MTLEFDLRHEIVIPGGVTHAPGTPVTRMTWQQASSFLEWVLPQVIKSSSASEWPPFDGYAVILPDGFPVLLPHDDLMLRHPALRVVK